MTLKDFLVLFLRSLTPGKYKDLKDYSFASAVKYFLFLLLICVFTFGSISLVKEFPLSKSIEDRIGRFDEFRLDLTIKATEPIILLDFPKIVLDFSGNRTGLKDEYAVITNDEIITKKFSPNISQFSLYNDEKTDISSYSDIVANKSKISGVLNFLAILILPSIFIVLYLYFMLRYLFFTALFFLISLVFFKTSKKGSFEARQLFKIALFSSTIMVLIDLLPKPFINLFISSVILYAAYFSLCLYLSANSKLTVSKKSSEKKDPKKEIEDYF
ncbi:MAG: hypothetical protein V1859_00450 [archaeon]